MAAGLLVLLGLGLFVGGVATGLTALYWSCVAACGLAAVLLVARRRATRGAGDPGGRTAEASGEQETPRGGAPEPAGATADRPPGPDATPAGPRAAEPAEAAPRTDPGTHGPPAGQAPARRGAHAPRERPADATAGEPGEEEVEVTDLLVVVDLDDEVLVVDQQPSYHLAGCPSLDGRTAVPLPMVEARTGGFTPCAACRPVRHLAETERSRRRAGHGS